MVYGEEENVDPTPIREEESTPSKGIQDRDEVTLTEGCDEEIQRNLQQKLQDPGKFAVLYAIVGKMVGKAICDSRTSVNVMLSSLYEKFGLSRIKPTELILQLADKSVKVPLGFVENVEVQIDKLRLPEDFVMLDIENDKNVLVIIGRPFLATAGAIIGVKQRRLTMEVEGQKVVIKASKRSHELNRKENLCDEWSIPMMKGNDDNDEN
ncbi:uncharacterized protein [Primulina eburnea]|uniref:uncharacterized protein n=1 Tax=Primulina eburnea TaxID=1245227 RepID=UPI003C6CC09F